MNNRYENAVLCSKGKGFSEQYVAVSWNTKYNRKPNPHLDPYIEELWKRKKNENVHLFDATKFRLHAVDVHPDGSIPRFHFLLGVTSYKEFIGTNCNPFATEAIEQGEIEGEDRQSFMADPLGVGSLVETVNNQFVFMRRSNTCAEAQGMIDRPGGHPEPQEIQYDLDQGLEKVPSSLLVKELYSSVLREIRDEVNIPLEYLDPPVLLGISYNPETHGRPSLEFYTKCSLTSDQVYEKYMEQTHSEREESVELILITKSELLPVNKLMKSNMWLEFTPSNKEAIKMYEIYHL